MQVLRSYAELGQWVNAPVVISVGFFDGVHRGHQQLIMQLREEAALRKAASLLITFSNSPRQFHDPGSDWKFLMTPEEKLYALSRSGADAVLMLPYDESICRQTAGMFIKGLAHFAPVRAFVFGYDTSIGRDLVSGEAALRELCAAQDIGCRIVPAFAPGTIAVKSSLLRELVSEGRMREATQLMGHPYFVLSRVVRGRGQGRELFDIPTANQRLVRDKLAPPPGIYAGSAMVGKTYLPAAICIMSVARARATVSSIGDSSIYEDAAADEIIVESHILDFSSDIYEQVIRLDFHRRIRDWQDFDNTEDLRLRMQEDIRVTREVSAAFNGAWEAMK